MGMYELPHRHPTARGDPCRRRRAARHPDDAQRAHGLRRHRELAADDPAGFEDDLAGALSNLGLRLSDLGWPAGAGGQLVAQQKIWPRRPAPYDGTTRCGRAGRPPPRT
jgi:hypothetical protein